MAKGKREKKITDMDNWYVRSNLGGLHACTPKQTAENREEKKKGEGSIFLNI